MSLGQIGKRRRWTTTAMRCQSRLAGGLLVVADRQRYRLRNYWRVAFLLSLLLQYFYPAKLSADPTLPVLDFSAEHFEQPNRIDGLVYVLGDKGDTYSAQTVLDSFQKLLSGDSIELDWQDYSKDYQAGFLDPGSLWFAVRIGNVTEKSLALYFVNSEAGTTDQLVYISIEGQPLRSFLLGKKKPFKDRPASHWNNPD